MPKGNILLLSGGIDSACLAAWLHPSCCIVVDYGQRAAQAEISASKVICDELRIEHQVISANIPDLGAGTMAGGQKTNGMATPEFWPFRNQYLITIAAMYCFINNYSEINIGTVSSDRERHKDGTNEFIERIGKLIYMQEGSVKVVAPALSFTTKKLIEISNISAEVLGWTHSCHISNLACGKCNGCIKHSEVMQSIGWNR